MQLYTLLYTELIEYVVIEENLNLIEIQTKKIDKKTFNTWYDLFTSFLKYDSALYYYTIPFQGLSN